MSLTSCGYDRINFNDQTWKTTIPIHTAMTQQGLKQHHTNGKSSVELHGQAKLPVTTTLWIKMQDRQYQKEKNNSREEYKLMKIDDSFSLFTKIGRNYFSLRTHTSLSYESHLHYSSTPRGSEARMKASIHECLKDIHVQQAHTGLQHKLAYIKIYGDANCLPDFEVQVEAMLQRTT
jgi:hypothetical protein